MNMYKVQNQLFIYVSGIMLVFATSINGQVRSIDGYGNNIDHPTMGAVGTNQLQTTPVGYSDGISELGGENRLNARSISNLLFHQEGLIYDKNDLSDYAWVWGQFIDHDITLIGDDHEERCDVIVPIGDQYFDPNSTGNATIPVARSSYDPATGTDIDNPRKFPNLITSYVDGSGVYGSDQAKADWLRTFTDGMLKTSEGNMLPYNTLNGEIDGTKDENAPEMANANPFNDTWFVAGDVRANENILLTSIHTLFLREHNRLCTEISASNPSWDDEAIYQKARKTVGAILQAIIYEEWLPSLGIVVPSYTGYDASIDPGIMNVFSAAAYRYGHTVINGTILRLDEEGDVIPQGNIRLFKAFFAPYEILNGGGINPLLRGMSVQVEQDFDTKMINDLRNFLFGAPGAGGLDLAAINMTRGRDRGLSDYNTIRQSFGLSRVSSFSNISSNQENNLLLEQAYGDIDDIDPWVGFLAEDHMSHSLFGETVMHIVDRQFSNLRSGDRFYYENDDALTEDEKATIKSTRLIDIIYRNTDVRNLNDDIFTAASLSVGAREVLSANEGVFIYPNPSHGHFILEVKLENSSSVDIEVHNMMGAKVWSSSEYLQAGLNTLSPPLTHLESGIYTLLVKSDDKVQSTKIVLR